MLIKWVARASLPCCLPVGMRVIGCGLPWRSSSQPPQKPTMLIKNSEEMVVGGACYLRTSCLRPPAPPLMTSVKPVSSPPTAILPAVFPAFCIGSTRRQSPMPRKRRRPSARLALLGVSVLRTSGSAGPADRQHPFSEMGCRSRTCCLSVNVEAVGCRQQKPGSTTCRWEILINRWLSAGWLRATKQASLGPGQLSASLGLPERRPRTIRGSWSLMMRQLHIRQRHHPAAPLSSVYS